MTSPISRMRKLMYRVVFPLKLKLTNTTAEGADSAYALAGVVVHVGSGPTHGESLESIIS